jgi:hypothetical protein
LTSGNDGRGAIVGSQEGLPRDSVNLQAETYQDSEFSATSVCFGLRTLRCFVKGAGSSWGPSGSLVLLCSVAFKFPVTFYSFSQASTVAGWPGIDPASTTGRSGPRRASTATLSSLLPGPSNVPLHKQPEDARSAPRPEHWHCPAASQKPEAATAAVAIMAGCHWQPPSQVDSELPQWQIVDFRFMPPGASGCRCQCRRNQSGIRRRSGMIARGFRL